MICGIAPETSGQNPGTVLANDLSQLDPFAMSTTAYTRPPAKLNLFLELLGKRADGFHEIDTVMIPIDWCDQMRIVRRPDQAIALKVRWLPSKEIIARRLGLESNSEAASQLLEIPEGSSNLVHRALSRFCEVFEIEGGFDCQLDKCIPAGAGMGGASSDAASALRCAAALCEISPNSPELQAIAAEVGSDVPFFLGLPGHRVSMAGRAQGRGEILSHVSMTAPIDFVVVYPALSLSTAKVYANSQVPQAPRDAGPLLEILKSGRFSDLGGAMVNRLADPAKILAPQIDEILESLWQVGLRTCQLTGSGSACFAIAGSRQDALRCSEQLRARLEPGAIVMPARSLHVPALVNLT